MSAYFTASGNVTFGPRPGDHDLDPRPPDAARRVVEVLDPRVPAIERERRLVVVERPGHDLEVLAEDRESLAEAGIVETERVGLDLAEAGAEAQDDAALRDDVQRRGHLGGQRRVVERGVHDGKADLDVRHEGGDRRRHDPDVERRRTRSAPLRGHVLAGPDRFEPERRAELRDLERALPGLDRVPAVVLVEVALRRRRARCASACSWPRPRPPRAWIVASARQPRGTSARLQASRACVNCRPPPASRAGRRHACRLAAPA